MSIVEEAAVEYRRTGTIANRNPSMLMQWVRGGIDFDMFQNMVSKFPFTSEEWSQFLHLSERTIQRYKKEKKTLILYNQRKFFKFLCFISVVLKFSATKTISTLGCLPTISHSETYSPKNYSTTLLG